MFQETQKMLQERRQVKQDRISTRTAPGPGSEGTVETTPRVERFVEYSNCQAVSRGVGEESEQPVSGRALPGSRGGQRGM